MSRRIKLLTAAAAVLGTVAIVIAERRQPLRRQTQAEPHRELVNLALGAGCAAAIMAVETPIVNALARRAERRSGLIQALPLPEWGRDLAGLLLMDYTFYIWHVLIHKVPVLWRFHLIHPIDLDLDASTALRFHALDMVISTPWRAGQVALIDLSPRALRLWQTFFFLSILFHHSNLRLPRAWERRLAWILTTPRMHGIHHLCTTRWIRIGRADSAFGIVCTAPSVSMSTKRRSRSGSRHVAIRPIRTSYPR